MSSASTVVPQQYNYVSGGTTVTVSGAGLSERDVFYAVTSGSVCSSGSGVVLSQVVFSSLPVVVVYGTTYAVTASISG